MKLGERVLGFFAALVRVCPLSVGGQARVLRRAIYILPTGAGLMFGGILILMLVGSLNYQNNLGLLITFLTTAIVLETNKGNFEIAVALGVLLLFLAYLITFGLTWVQQRAARH